MGFFYGRANSTRIMKRKINKIIKHFEPKFNLFAYSFFTKAIKPFSRFSRRVFEKSQIRQIFGLLVFSSCFSAAILPSSYSAIQTKLETNYSQTALIDPEIIQTKKSVRLPLDSFVVSQGFSFFHPGIDLAGVKGTPVYPIMDGTVTLVEFGTFGYGNYVLVDHGAGRQSLYAHLAKIEVKEGEELTLDSILGLLGSTGRSTGPHLHLQIFDNNSWINPRVFLESYFGQKLASK